jgi:hypothetical protein
MYQPRSARLLRPDDHEVTQRGIRAARLVAKGRISMGVSRLVKYGIAGCAIAALAPTVALASGGGSPVTITGPTGAKAHVAHGRLYVNNQPAVETAPFATFGRATNNGSDRIVIVGPTTHTIALSSLTASATGGVVGVRIRAVEPVDGSCAAGHTVTVRGEDMSFVVADGTSHSVEFPSPLIAKPARGHSICLIAHPDTTYVPASSATLTVSGSGYLR